MARGLLRRLGGVAVPAAATTALVVTGGRWLATASEAAALSAVVGLPIGLAAAGWAFVADALPSEEQLMESSSGGGLLVIMPVLPTAAALSALATTCLCRCWAGGPVFTPLLCRSIAGLCAVTVLGLGLVGTRERTLAWRRRDRDSY